VVLAEPYVLRISIQIGLVFLNPYAPLELCAFQSEFGCGKDMSMNRSPAFAALLGLLLFFFLVPTTACNRVPSARMESIAISPDGKLLAIALGDDSTSFIYKIDVESGNASRLTDEGAGRESSPAFSPDGKRISYSYSPGKGQPSSIVIRDVDGSNLHSWSSSGGNDYWPVFSLDSKTIIFARSAYYGNYSPIAQPHPHGWDLYAGDSDGKNVRQLTHEGFYSASPLSLSPDGKSMVLVTEEGHSSQQIAIYSLDQTGKPSISLRPHVPGEPRLGPEFASPNFMPDGKSILFMAASSGHGQYDYDVYRIDIAAGSVERLTQGNGFASGLKMSADGKTAVFLKWRLNWRHMPVQSTPYLLDVQTHKLTPLKVKGLPT
jgi:Tol biopolymer transport system component